MHELIYTPLEITGHPNNRLEEDLKSIEMLVEMCNNQDDLKKMYYLKDKTLRKKFDGADIALFTQFKKRYLKV